ncbi:MAG: SRPBCC family protein [Acidimicrobiales bacterium]|jgi:uncharacterized protein YndB with AHSA1/START domain|nr:SRPBCC family protein [Acidimicrobiales bacterium]
MADVVRVEQEISASPEQVWALISDVTRMGEWSPETESCEWKGGATGPKVGARFQGRNRNGKKQWSTQCTVTAAEPGRSFAFRVKAGPLGVAEWRYDLEPVDGGCRVTETWTDERGWLVTTLGKPVSGVADRAEHNRRTMAETLGRLTTAAEATDTGTAADA